MKQNDFVHLHVHSHFSLLDGNCQLDELLDAVRASGQDAIALTDHGNLFGAVHFYRACKQRDIRPILGIEAYIAAGSRHERRKLTRPGHIKGTYHATLLAKSRRGFENLMQLSSAAYVEGFYYKPRMDREILKELGNDIICLSGCLASEVNQAILMGRMEEAEQTIREYQAIFGTENFYLEVMRHGTSEQDVTRNAMKELSRVTGAPLVATNDIHYVRAEDWKAQDVALCIGIGKTEADTERFKMASHELYFKDTATMAALFEDMPQAIASTREIADRCKLDIPFGNRYLPAYTHPEGETPEQFFRRICREGIEKRYGEPTAVVLQRLEYEIDVIVKMGFVDYFLITWDFIKFARDNGIPVGPGRGSAAGSIVAYALEITQLDPIHYNLLFERFLNSERISMPDIDIDFCKDRREEVIRYVEQKYGRDRVAQIITFGTMKSRAVIRDVGRVLDIPLSEVDRIAKKIPSGPKDTLASALKTDSEVQKLYRESEQVKRLFDIAIKLEGSPRHASIHAAGVVISDRPLKERVPLYRSGDDITTQWTMDVLEDIGLLKVDFLGLRTLTIIKKAVDNIRIVKGSEIDIDRIPLDDPATYKLLGRGDANGVFQLESEGMKGLLKRLRPDCFDDIIAVLALYRPGPLGSGMVDSYVRRKHREEPISYLHPSLEPILKESLGVILYQEQVMRISNVLSGFSLNEADNLRKAMGKKKPEVLAKFKERFVQGAEANGVAPKVASEIFDLIEYFAGYGFNKSHSAAYAFITYQTAWLKANHPVEYMAGLLTCEMIQIDKTAEYIEECRTMGIEVLPPDVNRSFVEFAVEEGKIRFALAALKGVGETAVKALIAARDSGGPFKSLYDLCERVDLRILNKGALEALVNAGAADCLPGNRAQKCAALEEAMAVGAAAAKDRRSGQGSLFADIEDFSSDDSRRPSGLPDIPEFEETERLAREKSILGFFLSGHPLNRVRSEILRFANTTIADLGKREQGARVTVGGMISQVRVMTAKSGRSANQKFAVVTIEDFSSSCEAVIYSELYPALIDRLAPDKICFIAGEVDRRRETPSLIAKELIDIENAPHSLTRWVTLGLSEDDDLEMVLPALHRVLRGHPGSLPVYFRLNTAAHGDILIQAGSQYRVRIDPAILDELEKIIGVDRIRLN